MTLRVLLIEDDRQLRLTLRNVLEVDGYLVTVSGSLADAQLILRTQTSSGAGSHSLGSRSLLFDIVLLDLGLPDGDGSMLLREIRPFLKDPILIISARHDEAQKIALLDAGADDYLVKPFSAGELLARIRVALRHRGTHVQAPVVHYQSGDLEVFLDRHVVRLKGEAVHLTPREYKLLARLVRSAGKVVTHGQLLGDVWGAEFLDHTHYLRLYMGQLRAKLEAQPTQPRYLFTEPGIGYKLM